MNLVLLKSTDFNDDATIEVSGSQLKHLVDIKKLRVGMELTVGVLNGDIGIAKVLDVKPNAALLSVVSWMAPPKPLDVTVVLGLPRPQTLKKVIGSMVAMGVKRIFLIQTNRVEKSYWDSSLLHQENFDRHVHLGLEQGVDTVWPEFFFRKRFRPFVEDELPQLAAETCPLVAHPYNAVPAPASVDQPITLLVGPEGGFNDFEMALVQEVGFQSVSLGQRVMRVEHALPALLGRLMT
jgi:RsmE family RNA methyltransferase